MPNVLTHPWKKKSSSPVWRLRQRKIYYGGYRNYSSFTALKLSNYLQLFPIWLGLLMKGVRLPLFWGGHPEPPQPQAQRSRDECARGLAVGIHCAAASLPLSAVPELEGQLRRYPQPSRDRGMLTGGVPTGGGT